MVLDDGPVVPVVNVGDVGIFLIAFVGNLVMLLVNFIGLVVV